MWAALLGTSLMVGETIRSWGQGRNLLFVLDDFVIGLPLVITAMLMANPTPARQCAFSAAFAASAGMLYGSFFGKLVEILWWGQEPRFTDIGCLYRAIWKDSFEKIAHELEAKNKTFSLEMMIEIMRCFMVPLSRKERESERARESVEQGQLAQALAQKNRLAQLGLAVSKINHDLRNMLTSAQLISD
ncbi:MAG: hypothetical protein HC809_03100, partial [Gammaproteobacteria bacterium]|nr:hypothetical protein [Gammaproteobacteria bacterium]